MTTHDYSTGPGPSDPPDAGPEKIRDDPAGSYGRALAALIVAIADITSEPSHPNGRPGSSDE
jgi:hypothetical protein